MKNRIRPRVKVPNNYPTLKGVEPDNVSLSTYVTNVIRGEYEDRYDRSDKGVVEGLVDRLDRQSQLVGRLLEILISRGTLTGDEAKEIIDLPWQHENSVVIDEVDTESVYLR